MYVQFTHPHAHTCAAVETLPGFVIPVAEEVTFDCVELVDVNVDTAVTVTFD